LELKRVYGSNTPKVCKKSMRWMVAGTDFLKKIPGRTTGIITFGHNSALK
jgi:hypothetical protein